VFSMGFSVQRVTEVVYASESPRALIPANGKGFVPLRADVGVGKGHIHERARKPVAPDTGGLAQRGA